MNNSFLALSELEKNIDPRQAIDKGGSFKAKKKFKLFIF